MGLTHIAVHRAVFILMVFAAMIVLGLVAYTHLNAELYPRINTPTASVLTIYSGAAPGDVERLITQPLEDAVAGIANVDVISSVSSEERSQLSITFHEEANIDIAVTDVERRIAAVRGLPSDAGTPSVLKSDPAQGAVVTLVLTGDVALEQLYDFAKNVVKPRLESQPGVATAALTGGRKREIQVQVSPVRLRNYNLTLEQVANALTRNNQAVPGGIIADEDEERLVRLYGLFQSPAELRSLPVASTPAGLIRLSDVADVVETYARVTARGYLNTIESVLVTVTKQSRANEIATADAVHAEIARLTPILPPGARLVVIGDTSRFTRNSLDGVRHALFEAILLTGLVLLLFLHTTRSTLIVLFAIPTSLISTLLAMFFFGFTLNIMTSMALVLVIGVLVDDSIVVLENIFHYLELGEAPWTAALKGRSEIGLAAIAITLVDVVIFVPVAFMTGVAGQWLRQFGLVIATATVLSLFVSFTLTPLLASRWLSASQITPSFGPWRWFVTRFERGFNRLRAGYTWLLDWALRHRWVPPAIGVALLVFSVATIPLGLLDYEFLPSSDTGTITITVELPPGSSLSTTEATLRVVESRLTTVPEIDRFITIAGVGGSAGDVGSSARSSRFGRINVTLVDRQHRARTVWHVIDQVWRDTRDIPGAIVRIGDADQPVQVRISGEDYEVLQVLARRVEDTLRNTPGTRDVTNTASSGNPETRLVPVRERLAEVGITAERVGWALRTAVEGTVVTKLRPQGQDEVDVRLITTPDARTDLDTLGTLPLSRMRDGVATTLYLGQVTEPETVAGPTSIDRRNRQRLLVVGAQMVGTTPLSEVTVPLTRAVRQMYLDGDVPQGYSVRLGGEAEQQDIGFTKVLDALRLSVLLEYMLLAALYESMILPLATMFALPMALIGAFLILLGTGNSLNMLTLIGIVVLMGLVGKNGILLVDHTNSLRRQGLPRDDALRQAGPARLRPILMTTAALVFGLLPLATQRGESSEVYSGMAVAIIGGMISSTFLSLVIVPCMYTYFDDLQALIKRLWSQRARRGGGAAASEVPAGAQPAESKL